MLAMVIENVWRRPSSLCGQARGQGPWKRSTFYGPRRKSDIRLDIRVSDYRKRKEQNGTRFVSSHTAPLTTLILTMCNSPSAVRNDGNNRPSRRLVLSLCQGQERSSILRSAIKSLLIVKRTQSPVILPPRQLHLLL